MTLAEAIQVVQNHTGSSTTLPEACATIEGQVTLLYERIATLEQTINKIHELSNIKPRVPRAPRVRIERECLGGIGCLCGKLG